MVDLPVILTIDDQPVVLSTIHMLLKDSYKVISVTSGAVALKYLEMHDADLILSDINMPEMDGFELLKKIRLFPHCANTPVIFLTGEIGDETEYTALIQGAADYISKPIKASILIKRVKAQLDLYRYRRDLEGLVQKQKDELITAFQKLRRRQDVIFNLLARATDFRDKCTGGHILRTTEYVRLIVDELLCNPMTDYEITEAEGLAMVNSSKLHDIGKIGIPDDVLLKNGKLTDEEFSVIQTHTVLGGEILEKAIREMGTDPFLCEAYEIAVKHHEKWNGTGYPMKLAGGQIPLSARIMSLADVYDALISERPYKKPFSHEKSIEIIQEGAGTQFDPYLSNIFVRVQDSILKIKNSCDTQKLG